MFNMCAHTLNPHCMLEPQTAAWSHRLQTANQPLHYSLLSLVILTILSRKRLENKTKSQNNATLSSWRKNTLRNKQTHCLIEIILMEIRCAQQLLEEEHGTQGNVLWVRHLTGRYRTKIPRPTAHHIPRKEMNNIQTSTWKNKTKHTQTKGGQVHFSRGLLMRPPF